MNFWDFQIIHQNPSKSIEIGSDHAETADGGERWKYFCIKEIMREKGHFAS
ncbi:MAG: hypothetical protein ACI3ZY_02200 [Parabacteroides sp.]